MSLTKYAGFAEQDTAVGLYRIIQPGRFLKREKLVDESRVLPYTGESQTQHYQWSDKTWMEVCNGADILHTTLLWKQADILKVLNLRHHFGLKWVVDIDDNIYASSKDNAATDQAEALRPNRELCLSLADGVTVSVPALKELYGQFNPNVYVMPNGIDFKIWDDLSVAKKKKIRIGWRGALGHKEDLALVEQVLAKIKEAFPNVEFVTLGYECGFEDEHYSWVSSEKFPVKLSEMGVDIAIFPLTDSGYNRCKSNLQWLEWSALNIPVVYSPTENNKGLPGFPAQNSYEWFEALSKLIESAELRRSTGQLQNQHLRAHFNEKHLVYGLASWFSSLERRTDLEPTE